MYIVQWCDHEGNLRERRVQTERDAKAEAEELCKTYDVVQIIPEK